MQIQINKDIRKYSESVYFGLTMRQFVFSLLAVTVAVLLFFLLRNHFGTETVSWMCILGAAPFAALGFVNYHGMPAEKLLVVLLKSLVLEPKRLLFKPSSHYYELIKLIIKEKEKEAYRSHE